MKALSLAILWLFAAVVVTGCASSDVTERRSYARDEKIARPDRIIVYDFAASPADVRTDSAIARRYAQHSTPQTAEEIEVGRRACPKNHKGSPAARRGQHHGRLPA